MGRVMSEVAPGSLPREKFAEKGRQALTENAGTRTRLPLPREPCSWASHLSVRVFVAKKSCLHCREDFGKECAENNGPRVTTLVLRAKFTDFVSLVGLTKLTASRFDYESKELWSHCRADLFEENNGGVTGLASFQTQDAQVLYRISYLEFLPKPDCRSRDLQSALHAELKALSRRGSQTGDTRY
jgi:hypothetical protein